MDSLCKAKKGTSLLGLPMFLLPCFTFYLLSKIFAIDFLAVLAALAAFLLHHLPGGGRGQVVTADRTRMATPPYAAAGAPYSRTRNVLDL